MSSAALVFGATTVSAQAKPSFAGAWTVVVDPNAAPAPGRGGGRGGLGQAATIAQDAKTLTVTRTTQNGEVKTVYNLDGTDSKNTMTFGGNAVEQTSTSWSSPRARRSTATPSRPRWCCRSTPLVSWLPKQRDRDVAAGRPPRRK
jgi:hypothetical protein